MNYSYFRSF